MLKDKSGGELVETIVVAGVMIATVGAVLYAIFTTLQERLTEIQNEL